jgi:hypothetical protein
MKLEFSRKIFEKKTSQVSNFVKFPPLKAQLFHTGERTEIMKPIVAFRNFAKEPNKVVTWC